MIETYEIAVLYHPSLEVDLSKAEERVKKIISSNGGKLKSNDNWGKRKLAYPIDKQQYAIYVFYTVEVPTDNVKKIESTLNITDEVIRFLITRVDFKLIEAQAEKKAKTEARSQEAAALNNSKEK